LHSFDRVSYFFSIDSMEASTVVVKSVSTVAALASIWVGILFADAKSWFGADAGTKQQSLNMLYERLIPGLTTVALAMALVLRVRSIVKNIENPPFKKFGRKCLIVSTASILFVFSCFYRSINIADEGAFTCYGKPTAFNAPAAGRFVATIGEVALVVQTAYYINVVAKRLGVKDTTWRKVCAKFTTIRFSTIIPVLLAEICSWSGVISTNPKFFCMEYILWMVIALTWVWDGANLLHYSTTLKDGFANCGLLCAGLCLFCFNLFVEIPHFFAYDRSADEGSGHGGPPTHVSIFECSQDKDSPLWLKRLPFFVCYFIGCAWASVALTYQTLAPRNRPHRD
jgi:hypothetical protein